MGVALRKVAQHADQGQAEKGQRRELVLARRFPCIEMAAQSFQGGHVDFLDIAEVRNLAGCGGHALGDLAAQPDDLDLGGPGPLPWRVCCRGRRGGLPPAGDESFEVGQQYAAARAAAMDLAQVNAGFARAGPNRRRGHHLARVGGRRGCRRRRGDAGGFGGFRGRLRRCFAGRRFGGGTVGFEDNQRGAHGDHVAFLARDRKNLAADRRGEFHRRLVGQHRANRVFFGYHVTDLDHPLGDFGFDRAFAEVRQLESVFAHAASMTLRMPSTSRC